MKFTKIIKADENTSTNLQLKLYGELVNAFYEDPNSGRGGAFKLTTDLFEIKSQIIDLKLDKFINTKEFTNEVEKLQEFLSKSFANLDRILSKNK